MRRTIVIFTLLLTLSVHLFGQVSVVVKAGINLSSYSGLGSVEEDLQEYRPGYLFAVGLEIPLVQRLYVEPSLMLVQKGAQFAETTAEGESEMRVTPTYLELPVLLGYRFALLPGVGFSVLAGPYASYGFGGSWKYQVDGENYHGDAFGNTLGIEKEEAFSKCRWDCGVAAGAGIEVDGFMLRATYALGLTKVRRMSGGEVKNRGLAFAFGYKF